MNMDFGQVPVTPKILKLANDKLVVNSRNTKGEWIYPIQAAMPHFVDDKLC